jgi:hypothetical protein
VTGDHADDLRTFARRLKALRFRGTEAWLEDVDALALAMVQRASEVSAVPVRRSPAPEHARLAVGQTRVVGPTGAVTMVLLRRRRFI